MHVTHGAARAYTGPESMSSGLTGFVDAMADWDLACSDQARALTIVAARASGNLQRALIPACHLSRNFSEIFGMGPKQFARIARVEGVLFARARGATWAEIAHATGFTDQADMINDFTGIVGVSPGQLLRDNTRVVRFDDVSSRDPRTSDCLWAGFGRRRDGLGCGE